MHFLFFAFLIVLFALPKRTSLNQKEIHGQLRSTKHAHTTHMVKKCLKHTHTQCAYIHISFQRIVALQVDGSVPLILYGATMQVPRAASVDPDEKSGPQWSAVKSCDSLAVTAVGSWRPEGFSKVQTESTKELRKVKERCQFHSNPNGDTMGSEEDLWHAPQQLNTVYVGAPPHFTC